MKTKDNSIIERIKKQWDFLETLASKRRNIKKVRKCGKQFFTEGTYNRMGRCREKLWMWADKDKKKKKVVAVNESCKSNWCPVCAVFKARKEAAKITTCMKWIRLEKHKEFIFLTLTAPNVRGDKLKEEISRYNKAFKTLMGREEVERAVKGYIRKLEVTYNKNRVITPEMWYGNKKKHMKAMGYYFQSLGLKVGDVNPNFDTYHPHFHVMIAVNQSYFKDGRQYISPKRWLELWREVMHDKTITQVDVVRVRLDAAGKEVSEIAKYTAKDSDYTVSEDVFGAYYRALTHRQKITYGGLFAEAGKMYDDGKLDAYKDKDLTEYVYELFYKWDKDGYLLEDVRELTAEERAAIHGQAIEEMDIED